MRGVNFVVSAKLKMHFNNNRIQIKADSYVTRFGDNQNVNFYRRVVITQLPYTITLADEADPDVFGTAGQHRKELSAPALLVIPAAANQQ